MKNYDIAISFSNPDEYAAHSIFLSLVQENLEVYYYLHNSDPDIGQDLNQRLKSIYSKGAKYVVMLISKNYINPEYQFARLFRRPQYRPYVFDAAGRSRAILRSSSANRNSSSMFVISSPSFERKRRQH